MNKAAGGGKWGKWLLIVMIAAGIFLRANRYFHSFPFWGDEAWVALDVLIRSWHDTLFNINKFTNLPAPPVGFMILEKWMVGLLGRGEAAFRFVPFVAGVAALFLFRKMVHRIAGGWAVYFAMAFLVFSNSHIFYSSELKQYSTDALATVLFLLAHNRAIRKQMSSASMVLLALAGLGCMSLSLPLVLVATAAGLSQIGYYLYLRRFLQMRRYLLIYGLWLMWFAVLWMVYFRDNYVGNTLASYLQPHYLSTALQKGDGGALLRQLLAAFADPVGLGWQAGGLIMLVLGLHYLWRQDRESALALGAPLLLTMLLSAVGKYPIHGRYLVFLLPVFYALIACGLAGLVHQRRPWVQAAGLGMAVLLLWHPLVQAGKYVQPAGVCDTRLMVEYIQKHQQPGDKIYLNNETLFGYFFYYYPEVPRLVRLGKLIEWMEKDSTGPYINFFPEGQLAPSRIYAWDNVVGPDGLRQRLAGGGRVWILFTEMPPETMAFFVRCLDGFGSKLEEVRSYNAAVYLYQLQ